MKNNIWIFEIIKRKGVFVFKRISRKVLKDRYLKKQISGNGFANLCDLIIYDVEIVSIERIERAKTIFVKSDFLIEFLSRYSEYISDKILLSGNSDKNFNYEIPDMYGPKKIYIQNLGFIPRNERINLLPIGLENLEHVRAGFAFLHRKFGKHRFQDRVLIPAMSATNPVRARVLEQVQELDQGPVYVETKYRSVIFYLRQTKKYKFVLVCEGNGYDTHRLWETLYQGSFPVVFRTPFSNNLENLGLPVLVISDLKELSFSLLAKHQSKHRSFNPKNTDLLLMDHWKKRLIQDQE
jgi:hypothetical protein